jgi:hypothetical protein
MFFMTVPSLVRDSFAVHVQLVAATSQRFNPCEHHQGGEPPHFRTSSGITKTTVYPLKELTGSLKGFFFFGIFFKHCATKQEPLAAGSHNFWGKPFYLHGDEDCLSDRVKL